MEIIHHFWFRISGEDEKREFLNAGIQLKSATQIPDGSLMTSLDIAESDPRCAEVVRLAATFKAIETISTRFTPSECDSAKYLGVVANSHRDYPQPSADKGHASATFDFANFCNRCGVGRRQVRPFHIKAVRKLHDSMIQLNWVFDEYFVAPEVWAGVFKPMGIGYRPVLKEKTGSEMDSIVQLDIDRCVDLKLREDEDEKCSDCGRRKRAAFLRGYFPEPVGTDAPMFKSKEYFGSGAGAFKLVFVSNPMYRRIRDASLRGVNFYPCSM